MAMKACVLHGIGDLRVEEVELPKPGEGQVLLRVDACGVCGSDIPRVFQKGTYAFPTIPGHEMAGTVAETGPGVEEALLGERVAVFPLIPCKKCAPCEAGRYALCQDYNYLGSRCDGGFAEYVVAPAWNLLTVPEEVSVEEAAMAEPAAVAVHALLQAGVRVGDSVMIFGAGPIGLMLAMWAEAWGAGKVALADIDDRKLEFANDLGFDLLCNPLEGDPVEWARDMIGGEADLVVEASGSSAAFEQSMLAAKTLGRVVLMGNPAGEMKLSQKAYWAILRKELRLFGTWNSSYSDIPRNEWRLALDFMASGKLNLKPLISHRVNLDGLLEAMEMMRDRKEFSNKVMLVNARG